MNIFRNIRDTELKELQNTLDGIYPDISSVINKQLDTKIGCININVNVPIYSPFKKEEKDVQLMLPTYPPEKKIEKLIAQVSLETIEYYDKKARDLYPYNEDQRLSYFIMNIFRRPLPPGYGFDIHSLEKKISDQVLGSVFFMINVVHYEEQQQVSFYEDGKLRRTFNEVPKGVIVHEQQGGNYAR